MEKKKRQGWHSRWHVGRFLGWGVMTAWCSLQSRCTFDRGGRWRIGDMASDALVGSSLDRGEHWLPYLSDKGKVDKLRAWEIEGGTCVGADGVFRHRDMLEETAGKVQVEWLIWGPAIHEKETRGEKSFPVGRGEKWVNLGVICNRIWLQSDYISPLQKADRRWGT